MSIKKIVSLVLCFAFLLSLTACKSRKKEAEDIVQTLPPIETAVQKEYTTQQIFDMYNSARDKIAASESYHMHGSSNSTSVYGGVLTSVINTYDVKYANVDGKTVGFFDSEQIADGSDYSHTTYFDGEYYYYTYSNLKYYKDANDFQDFFALDWLMPIGDVEPEDLDVMDQLDGSVTVSLSLPMGEYMSEAVLNLIGFYSETFEEDMVHLSFNLDSSGTMTYFYISYTSSHTFLNEETEQTVIVSMTLDEYDTTTVEAPADLASYENFIEEGSHEEHEGVGILSPEDVD